MKTKKLHNNYNMEAQNSKNIPRCEKNDEKLNNTH